MEKNTPTLSPSFSCAVAHCQSRALKAIQFHRAYSSTEAQIFQLAERTGQIKAHKDSISLMLCKGCICICFQIKHFLPVNYQLQRIVRHHPQRRSCLLHDHWEPSYCAEWCHHERVK